MRTTAFAAVLCVLCVSLAHAQGNPPPDRDLPALRGTHVSIPWQELVKLLDRSKPVPEARPPVDYVFSAAAYTVKVGEDVATVTGECELSLLREDWTLVSLGPVADGMKSVTVDGKPCPVVLRGQLPYALLSGKGVRKLRIVSERPVDTRAGWKYVAYPSVPSPMTSFTIDITGTDLEIMLGRKIVPGTQQPGGVTRVAATRAGGSLTDLAWRREPREERPTRIDAATRTLVSVADGLLRVESTVAAEVLHRPAKQLVIDVDPGVAVVTVTGGEVARWSEDADRRGKRITVMFAAPVSGRTRVSLLCERDLPDAGGDVALLLPSVAGAKRQHGSVGVCALGGFEVKPNKSTAVRVDVEDLPRELWGQARSPLLMGFQYAKPGAGISLSIRKHKDVEILVAMSDVCEATTTVTPDGKSITKMMYLLRNNLKQFMVLEMPKDTQIWSVFVNDRPARPSRDAAGRVLIPLAKSEEVDEDDKNSYTARREKRRSERRDGLREARKRVEKVSKARDAKAADLKPYDVEVVFVRGSVELADRGELAVGLPKSDIPTGQMAWAIFLPKNLRVLDVEGNVKEVSRFSLPFRHFGEAEFERQERLRQLQDAAQLQKMAAAMDALEAQEQALAAEAKAKGVLPVRVEIPITGAIHRFEKFLVVDEQPGVTLLYRKKTE